MHDEKDLQNFANEHGIQGLTLSSLDALKVNEQGYTIDKAKRFLHFQNRIDKELLNHRIIQKNDYCRWFE